MSAPMTTLITEPTIIPTGEKPGKVEHGVDFTKDNEEVKEEEEVKGEEEEEEEEKEEEEEQGDDLGDDLEDKGEEDLAAEVKRLRKQVATLATSKEKGEEEEEEVEEKEAKAIEIPIGKFVTEDELDDALKSPEAFNKVLTKVAQVAYNTAIEHTARSIPAIVNSQVSRAISLSNMINTFYASNNDLYRHRRYVATVYEEIREKRPDLKDGEIFDKYLARVVRKRLSLGKVHGEGSKGHNKVNIASPGGGHDRGDKGKGKLSPSKAFNDEIDLMSRI